MIVSSMNIFKELTLSGFCVSSEEDDDDVMKVIMRMLLGVGAESTRHLATWCRSNQNGAERIYELQITQTFGRMLWVFSVC